MADIDLTQGQSLPEGTVTRYQDMGDGTHALVVSLGTAGAGSVAVTDVIPGTGANNLGKAEDTLHNSGDVGVMGLAIRQDVAVPQGGANDYVPLQTDITGRLWTRAAVSEVIPGTGATNLGKREDQLHASADTGVMMLAVRNDTRTQAPVVDAAYGPLTIDDQGSTLVHVTSGNVPATWNSVAVSGNTSGDNELVAVVGGQRIYIVGITLVAQGDVDVVLESGTAGPDLTGAISLSADGVGFVWPIAPRGWWARTDVGESLNMRLNAAVFVTGIVTYYTV